MNSLKNYRKSRCLNPKIFICITFFRYDCNTTVAKGRLLISPGDLTHIYNVNPVSNGKFEFVSSKFQGGDVLCQEIHGRSYCPGFDFNSSNMEKLL